MSELFEEFGGALLLILIGVFIIGVATIGLSAASGEDTTGQVYELYQEMYG